MMGRGRSREDPGWMPATARTWGRVGALRSGGLRRVARRLRDLYSQGGYSRFLAGRYSRRREEDYRLALGALGELFADGSGRRLLDYGCGIGSFLEFARASAVSTRWASPCRR